MEHIKTVFDEANVGYSPAIRFAFRMAKRTLLRYYNLTDKSSAYRIAMGAIFSFYSGGLLCDSHHHILPQCCTQDTNYRNSSNSTTQALGSMQYASWFARSSMQSTHRKRTLSRTMRMSQGPTQAHRYAYSCYCIIHTDGGSV